MPGAKAKAGFFLALTDIHLPAAEADFFFFAFWPKFICLLRLHFSWLFCKKYPAWLYRNYPTCGPTWGYGSFTKFTCLPRVNYSFALFKNYHAQCCSWGRFFSDPFTDIHCLQPKQILFIWFLTGIYLPAEPAFFSAFLQNIPCPVLQELPYLWPNLRLQLFP